MAHAEGVAVLQRENDAGAWDPRAVAAFVEVPRGLGHGAARRRRA